MKKRSESIGRGNLGPTDPEVTKSGIYAQVGPKRNKGVGMIRMGKGSENNVVREPVPEHALEASRRRAKKLVAKQNAATANFARRAELARKKT